MDKGSVMGLLLLCIAIMGGILSSDVPFLSFINIPSVFIVVIGTFGAVMISFRLSVFFDGLANIVEAFRLPTTDPQLTIDQLVALADISRKGGFLALERVEIADPFLEKAIHLLIDGHTIDAIENTLTKDIFLTKERNNASVKVLNSFTETAPAMGMVGTLIGLVAMLLTMDDPKTIGKSMAVAMLTTFYGALIANGVTGPLARKLSERSVEIKLHQSMIKDAVMKIGHGENPKAIYDYLQSYIDERKRRPQEGSAFMDLNSDKKSNPQ